MPRFGRISDGEIDEKSGDTHLRINLVTERHDGLAHGFLEGRILIAFGIGGDREMAGSGVVEKGFEGGHASAGGAFQIDIFRDDRGKDLAAFSRARDEDVQAALAAVHAERAEAHGQVSVGILAVADGNQDDIALVTLDIFQVFHEERLIDVIGEKRFGVRMLAAGRFQFIENGLLLADRKSGDAQAGLLVIGGRAR